METYEDMMAKTLKTTATGSGSYQADPGGYIQPIGDSSGNSYNKGFNMFAPIRSHKVYDGENTYNTFDQYGNELGSGGDWNTDFSFNGAAGNFGALGDLLGSKGFSNATAGIGMAANAYMNYTKMENERKFQDKMFDLQEGQINKDNKRIADTQANYNASQKTTP